MGTMRASVVVPVYNGGAGLPECLRALSAQTLPRADYEIIVVDDGSTDDSAKQAERFHARLLRQENRGAAAARNKGLSVASGEWVAFTDADCLPSRGWLEYLLVAVAAKPEHGPVLGAAGRIVGFPTDSAAARFVDLTGALDAERHLAHPRFPFAPSGNVMYRRSALLATGGFDARYVSYEACELHQRLLEHQRGEFYFAPRAVVLHRHRSSWREYVRQQFNYGRGMGQFYWHQRTKIGWSFGRELSAWMDLMRAAAAALPPGGDDRSLVRRGMFLKQLAQRLGFDFAYWNRRERSRW
jgi:glycosyltransferase involved in cell wall biosynthesis